LLYFDALICSSDGFKKLQILLLHAYYNSIPANTLNALFFDAALLEVLVDIKNFGQNEKFIKFNGNIFSER
jgi:hypothetical protein